MDVRMAAMLVCQHLRDRIRELESQLKAYPKMQIISPSQFVEGKVFKEYPDLKNKLKVEKNRLVKLEAMLFQALKDDYIT